MKNLTIQEAAEEARCNHHTIRRALHKGEMPMFKIGRNLLIKRCDFDAWFKRHQVMPQQDPRLMTGLHAEVERFMKKGAAA